MFGRSRPTAMEVGHHETFLDPDIYEDDSPVRHCLDDEEYEEEEEYPVSCFAPENLARLAGTEALESCTSLELRADTTREDLTGVGKAMPSLTQLRVSNSILPTARTFGSTFQRLQVLWVARSGLEDLNGIASLVELRELYAAFNDVSDVSPLADLDHLEVLDVEANKISDPDAADYLGMIPTLTSVTFEGNPLSQRLYYRRLVVRAIPGLEVLDDQEVNEADRNPPPPGAEDADDRSGGAASPTGKTPRRSRMSSTGGDGVDGATEEEEDSDDGGDPMMKALEAEKRSAQRELALITDGIKYAAVGIDDPDAVLVRDETTGDLAYDVAEESLVGDGDEGDAGMLAGGIAGMSVSGSRPGTAGWTSRPGTASRPGSSRPLSGRSSGSNGSGNNSGARPPTALVRSNSLGAAVRGGGGHASGGERAGSRAGSRGAVSRPGTALSGGASRPGTAASWGARAASRQGGTRPGTALSAGASRPSTAMSAEGNYPFGGLEASESLFWRKNRVKESRAGLSDRGDTANGEGFVDGGEASRLTSGGGMLCGNPAKMLSRRKRQPGGDASPEAVGGGGADRNRDGKGNDDDILAELRQWKIDMAATFSRFEKRHGGFPVGGVGGRQQQRFVPMPPPGPKPGQSSAGSGPGSGVVLRTQNPTPRMATETSSGGVDRLVLE